MPASLEPNVATSLDLTTALLEVTVYSTWLIVWASEGSTVHLVTGDHDDGDAMPATTRPIPASCLPFPIDVSVYGGRVFLAASAACTATVEGRE